MKQQLRLWLLLGLGMAGLLAAGETKIDLSGIAAPVLSVHVNHKPASPPPGAAAAAGKEGIVLDYVFPSPGHDACMVEFPVSQDRFSSLSVELTAVQTGHRPFVVLTDRNGEKHYFSLIDDRLIEGQRLSSTGRQTLTIPIAVRNRHPGEKLAWRWGGDRNQIIDFPVKQVMLGLNDSPDLYQGHGRIIFHSITFR